MQVYNKIIQQTNEILANENQVNLKANQPYSWKMLEENEFLLKRDIAFELGIRTLPSTCYNAVTSDNDLVGEDKITLIGPDMQDIKGDVPFTRITFINIDNIEDPNKAYQKIKKLEFARFKIIPQGYMMLSSSMDNKEEVRVSKEAISKGLDFQTVGNMVIDKYKKEYGANFVQVIFITKPIEKINELVEEGKKVTEITNAFDHVLKNIIVDCDVCPLHAICDDVEELRELHFDVNKQKN